jgi:predicted dehydrogenase
MAMRVALLGLGKMGLSHLAILKAHPGVTVAAVCDNADYLLQLLHKYAGVKSYRRYQDLFRSEPLDAVVIATPSALHEEMVDAALDANLHVFCEKPFCLNPAAAARLAEKAAEKQLVNQVGYHYRFVATFERARRLIAEKKAIGDVSRADIEALGPVVVRARGMTWRTRKAEGGGCLYDYAVHAIDLSNYLLGTPTTLSGSMLTKIFSQDVDDAVASTLVLKNGATARISANWSDQTERKMSMKVTVWGTKGKIVADRQELHVYANPNADAPAGLSTGWNAFNITELAGAPWFYLRGEEYSDQIEHFVQAVEHRMPETRSSFRSAATTDAIAAAIRADAARERPSIALDSVPAQPSPPKRSRWPFHSARR